VHVQHLEAYCLKNILNSTESIISSRSIRELYILKRVAEACRSRVGLTTAELLDVDRAIKVRV
jgi:hypothetical protein